MLVFEPFSVGVLQKALPYIKNCAMNCSDVSVGSINVWSSASDVRFCIWNDTFILQQDVGGQPAFTWPIGADIDGMLDELQTYVRSSSMPLRFFDIDADTLASIRCNERLRPAMWSELHISRDHPQGLAEKYLVHINSPAARFDRSAVVSSSGVVLTSLRESDKAAYLALNTDIDNNRYWGYDYREDTSIIGPINEDTFFDSVQYDMQVGDSINFAVRLAENGEMIGEAILWNFTADGSAELGCRLQREYHGKGYGKAAFGALTAFAEQKLGLRVWARCFRQNEASCRMIEANQYKMVSQDEHYYYFERNND